MSEREAASRHDVFSSLNDLFNTLCIVTSGMHQDATAVYRILDANLNRLREALRVVEEHYRFIRTNAAVAAQLKAMRHSLQAIEADLGPATLLACRDTQSDPFSHMNRPEELERGTVDDVLSANLKRAQEAARVIEEYVKLTAARPHADSAKDVRFGLYALEKGLAEDPSP